MTQETKSSANWGSVARSRLEVLRRRWYAVAIPLVLAPSLAYLVAGTQATEYGSTAKLIVEQRDIGLSAAGVGTPYQDPKRLASTAADIVELPVVAERAAEALARPRSDGPTLSDMVSVAVAPEANVITVSARSTNPAEARRVADAFADAATAYDAELERRPIVEALKALRSRQAELREEGITQGAAIDNLNTRITELSTLQLLVGQRMTVVQTANEPIVVWPLTQRILGLGLLFGALLGILAAYLLEAFDRRVRDTADASDLLGAPLLGSIPVDRGALRGGRAGIATNDQPQSALAESYRVVEAAISLARIDGAARGLLITSATPGEGKTTLAANLAVAAAQTGQRVAVLDLDLRRPTLSSRFGLPRQPGLTDLLRGASTAGEVRYQVEVHRSGGLGDGEEAGSLCVVPAGTLPPNPLEYLRSGAMRRLLRDLIREFDVVLGDAPPILGLSDVMALSDLFEDMVVVVNRKGATRPLIGELRARLERLPSRTVGMVAVGYPAPTSEGYYGRSQTAVSDISGAQEEPRTEGRHRRALRAN